MTTAATVGVDRPRHRSVHLPRGAGRTDYATKNGKSRRTRGASAAGIPITLTPTSTDALADGWTRYNFNGYEGRPAYGEYRDLVNTMADLGEDPQYGCGRAEWENNGDTGAYGTTMALMLLPHWTDGCITSMEGVFFEASGTTPYHFLTAAAISENSSNPVRELRYDDNNAAIGVPYMQKLGVKYLMVFTEKAKTQADAPSAELTKVATSGPVEHLPGRRQRPRRTAAGATGRGRTARGDQRERNLELGTSWFQHTGRVGGACRPTTDRPSGSASTSRSTRLATTASRPTPGRKVDIVVPDGTDRAGRAARRRRHQHRARRAGPAASTSTRSACRCWSRSATSRTGRSTVPRARSASART